ncbi:MAG: LPS export ABC transporter permease LptF [Candidatus Acidiferrales bacterium]
MRILDRYICREVISHSLLGLAVFTFVFFVPQLARLMEIIVRHSGGAGSITLLFLCSLTPVLAFTLPMATLVGVLIGLGRMSADSEIIALNASGIGLRRLLVPVGAIAVGAGVLTCLVTLWLSPLSLREFHSLEAEMASAQAPFAVQPRVFDERFPRLVLYVQDVEATAARWHGVFLAESDAAAGSHLTLAESAIVVGGSEPGKFELHLDAGTTHEFDPQTPANYNVTTFGSSDLPVEMASIAARTEASLSDAEQSTHALLELTGPESRAARTEFQRRLAFPAACLVFALLGVPIGVRPRRGGRAAGFVLTLVMISLYYLVFVAGTHYAQLGAVSPVVGVWAANIVAAVLALILLRGIEHTRGQNRFSRAWEALASLRRSPDSAPRTADASNGHAAFSNGTSHVRNAIVMGGAQIGFPLLIDVYILRTFFSFFVMMLAGFVVIFDAFTLFDLLGDISRHQISWVVVANYFRFLVPLMVYQLTPLAVLVATLVTLGTLAKNNEVTAFKASGVSLYRLCLPLILAGLLLAGGMSLLDDTFLPYANQRQDALRNEIKGRPAQTYFQPTHQWIFGENAKIFNYRLFDSDQDLFGGLSIFELDPATFQMKRRIYASRAKWEPTLNSWILEEGWVRDFNGGRVKSYVPFKVISLPEFSEAPGYFKREVRQSYQMNWRQLAEYIRGLRQAGFDTSRLAVQWHKKFAFPLIAAIIAFLSAPFAFLVGTRGAVGGLAVAIGIGITYWAASALFEAMGAVGQLPPILAGWAPDAIFFFLAVYFFLKMPT